MAASTMPINSTAAAPAGNQFERSGSLNQRSACTASVGGSVGPSTSETSTTDSENVSTAITGRRNCGQMRGSTVSSQARHGP